MIKQVNHIGIAVKSLDEHIPFYRDVLGLKLLGIEEVADQHVRTAIFQVGEVRIELLEPTDAQSPIAGFLQKRGEGMHHIALQSDNLEQELKQVQDKGVRLIDKQPRLGAHNLKIAFLHPKSTGNVLIELCEK
jgi:methylmalonyl-CoA/ethylmalonyl-CoA epimerase